MIKKHLVEFILPAILVLSVGVLIGVLIRNIDYIDYVDEIKHLENEVVEAYDKGYLDGENHAIIDLMEDYYEILIENAVLEEKIKWLSPSVIIHEFNPNHDFYLLVVVSREKTKTDFVWTYGLQMLDNNSDTAYIDSDKLFSIGEYVLAVELNENSVILIDLMENVVLNNQPSNEKYIEQILDDFELLIELQQHYYQENITSHSFGDWIQINYPSLYKRILNYF